MLRTVRRVGSNVLVVGDQGKLVVAFPGVQDKNKDEKTPKYFRWWSKRDSRGLGLFKLLLIRD